MFEGCEGSVGKRRKFWRWAVIIVAQQCNCACCHRPVPLNMVKIIHFMLCICYHTQEKKSLANTCLSLKSFDPRLMEECGRISELLQVLF